MTTNPEYGECFVLFSQETRQKNAKSERQISTIEDSDDIFGGLHLVLDAHNKEYVPFLTEEGFVLMIHGFTDDADVSEQGIMIPTNRATYVGVEKVQLEDTCAEDLHDWKITSSQEDVLPQRFISLMEAPYNTKCHSTDTWPPEVVDLHETLKTQVSDRLYTKSVN